MSNYKIINGERILMTPEEEAEMFESSKMPEYIANRTGAPEATDRSNTYPGIAEQLDMLWHDINNGVFGEQAKNSSFYETIKTVKINNPKE